MATNSSKPVLNPLQKIFGEDFNLLLFVTTLKRSLIWIVIFVVVALAVAQLYLRYSHEIYEASAKLMFKEKEASEALEFVDNRKDEARKDVEIIRSKEIIGRAIKQLPLAISYFEQGNVLSSEFYKNPPFEVTVNVLDSSICDQPIYFDFESNNTYSIRYTMGRTVVLENFEFGKIHRAPHFEFIVAKNPSQSGNTSKEFEDRTLYFVINSTRSLIHSIMDKLRVAVINSQTQTVDIRVQDRKPEKAEDIANAISAVYVDYDVERQRQSAKNILALIDQQVDSITTELVAYEEMIKEFKKNNRIINPDSERGLLLNSLEAAEETKSDLRNKIDLLNNLRQAIRNDAPMDAVAAGAATEFPQVAAIMSRLSELELQRDQLDISFNQGSIDLQQVEKQIAETREVLVSSIEAAKNRLRFELEALVQQTAELEGRFGTLPEKEAELARLLRLSSLKEKYYLTFLEKQTEYEIIRASIVPQYIILEQAESATLIAPKKRLIQMAGVGIGLFLGLLLVVIRYLLQNKILSVREIEENSPVPVLGIIPHYKNKNDVSEVIVSHNPKAIISEAFRSIRTNLQFFAQEDDAAKSMAVTSTVSGEGKTFVALNMAAIITMTKKKVVIVDFDMRKPKVHLAFKAPNDKGISTLLIGKHTIEDCIQESPVENLYFIPSGPIPPNPAELILSQKRKDLITELKQRFDLVVIDTPPVGLVADALELIKTVDYPIYILRAEYSRRDFINHPNRLYNERKAPHLSIILNDVDLSGAGYGRYNYSYGYGYSYAYGSGYYGEEEKPTLLQQIKKRIGL